MGRPSPGSDPLAQEAVARGLVSRETLAEFERHAAAKGRSVLDLLVAAGRLRASDLEALARPAPSTRVSAESTLVQEDRPPGEREPEREDLIGRVLGGARIEARIGKGGMGVVYRAHHLTLDKPVAIKVLSRRFVSDRTQVMRFIQEARAAARVEHQHLIQVHDVDCEDDVYYLVMQYVEGCDLAERLARGPLPVEEGGRIFLEVFEGIEEAHKSGIIHRDLKPGNILLDRYGRVKVTDFGLAQDRMVGEWSSGRGEVQGTPQYMSPEQCRGEPVDVRSDVYSLGMTFYHALTGVLPFDGDDPWEVVRAQIERFPPLPGTVRPDLPRGLCQILERMIAKRPENRYPSVQAVRRDLEPIVRRWQAVSATPVLERGGRSAGQRRRPAATGAPWMAAGLVAACALVPAGIALALLAGRGGPEEPVAGPVEGEPAAPLDRAQAQALLARIDSEWLPAAEAGRLEDSLPRVLEGAGRVLASPHEDLHLAALVARIRAHSIAGRSDLALADAHALGRFEPGLMQASLQRARSAALAELERRFEAGQFVSAHEFAESAARSDPETWHFHYARGRAALLCAESGRPRPTYEEALAGLDEAVRLSALSPLHHAVLHVRARARYRLGRLEGALQDVEASIAANDRGDFLLESIEILGLALARLDRTEEAFLYLSVVRHAGRAVLDPQWAVYADVQRRLGEPGPASHERIEASIRVGARVTGIAPRRPGPSGLEDGDVVLEVRDVRIYSPERLRAELLDRSRPDHAGPVRARVVRGGEPVEVEVLPEAIEDLQARVHASRR